MASRMKRTSRIVASSMTLSPLLKTLTVSVAIPAGPVTATSAGPARSAARARTSPTASWKDSSEALPVMGTMTNWVSRSSETSSAAAPGVVAVEITPVTCSGRASPERAELIRATASSACAPAPSPSPRTTTIAGIASCPGSSARMRSRAFIESEAAGGRLAEALSSTDSRVGAT